MKRLRFGILVGILAALLLSVTPVYADQADPDSAPTVDRINVYRNLLETNDRLFLIYANIPYASIPDDPVTQAFIWQLIDTDNVTELGSTVGYAFNDIGYGYNVYSMYIDGTENITWDAAYTIRLLGNPAVFDTPPEYNFAVNSADFSPLTTGADNRAELAARILTLAGDLDSKWGLTATYSLVLQQETGTVLSMQGEAFFRGAIYGLQALAPAAFKVVVEDINAPDRDWDTEYADNLTGQWAGTWIETAQEGGKVLFGTDYDLLSIILLLVMGVGLVIGNVMLTGDTWNGFIDVAFLMIIGAKLGMYGLGFLGLIAAMCIIYIGAKIWFGGIVK